MIEESIKQLKEIRAVLNAIGVRGEQDVFNMAYAIKLLSSMEQNLTQKAEEERKMIKEI